MPTEQLHGKALAVTPSESRESFIMDPARLFELDLPENQSQSEMPEIDMARETYFTNKTSFHTMYPLIYQTAIQEETPISVMFADADGLKAVNKKRGQLGGDLLIEGGMQASKLAVARMIAAKKIAPILVGFIGGDEIAAVSQVGEEGIKDFASHLYNAYEEIMSRPEYAYLLEGMRRRGLSIGTSTHENPEHEQQMDGPTSNASSRLLTEADNAMQADKSVRLPKIDPQNLPKLATAFSLFKELGIDPRDAEKYYDKYYG